MGVFSLFCCALANFKIDVLFSTMSSEECTYINTYTGAEFTKTCYTSCCEEDCCGDDGR